jgi:protein phosphatase
MIQTVPHIDSSVKQWIGARKTQEDNASVIPVSSDSTLLLLGDGMGGHEAGDVASEEVTKAFAKYFLEHSHLEITERLDRALEASNAHLAEVQKKRHTTNMGTTLVAAYIKKSELWWISVGDSHLYLWRPAEQCLQKLNEDHSMWPLAEAEWKKGNVSYEYALRQRSILRSALMGDEPELIDLPTEPIELREDDIIFLSSDGLDDWLENVTPYGLELLVAHSQGSMEDFTATIMKQVEDMEVPWQDNVTLVATRIHQEHKD